MSGACNKHEEDRKREKVSIEEPGGKEHFRDLS
jgi:hypothetical protein